MITATVADSDSGVAIVKWAVGELTAGDFEAVTTALASSTDNYVFDATTIGWFGVVSF
jgi:hypothetical protein